MSAPLALRGGPLARPSIAASVSRPSLDRSDHLTGGRKVSFEEFFRARWVAFLKANFRSDAEIAVAFNVTEVTARNWKAGLTAPRGLAVALAFRDRPDEAAALIRDRGP